MRYSVCDQTLCNKALSSVAVSSHMAFLAYFVPPIGFERYSRLFISEIPKK